MSRLDERLNGLRWRLRASRRLWSAGASPEMPFIAPKPPEVVDTGNVDQALLLGDEGMLQVMGWATFLSGPTSNVEVWLGDRSLGRARTGLLRPDVEAVNDLPYARLSGFELVVSLGGPVPAGAALKAVATGARGEVLELRPEIVRQVTPKTKSRSLEPPAPVPESPANEGPGVRTLVATHQLTLGGAQLYLMDLLRGLEEIEAIQPTVVAAIDGPLRPHLEAKGIPVHVTNTAPAEDLSGHLGRAEELAAWARPRGFEMVLINTATSGVVIAGEVAATLDLPAIWAIHESFEPPLLWAGMDREVRSRTEETLGKAAALVFEAEATARIFDPLIDPARSHVLPYGLDLEPIDAARAEFDPAAARREAEIPEEAQLIVCIGTVEERKAQIPLAQAFDLIAGRHPRAHLAFVGGRAGSPYSEALEELIEDSPHRERMRLIPITPDVETWYGMADLLVCASDVESLPRTVLEAMAWETPVLATSVFGLPELIEDGETGWLCESRDLVDLSRGLEAALDAPQETCERIVQQGRALVEQRHSLPRYAEQMSKLFGKPTATSSSNRRISSE